MLSYTSTENEKVIQNIQSGEDIRAKDHSLLVLCSLSDMYRFRGSYCQTIQYHIPDDSIFTTTQFLLLVVTSNMNTKSSIPQMLQIS